MLNIIANLVAFVSFIYFADAILTWITSFAGFEDLNLHSILGKIFTPISWLIGIDWKDCENVGYIIGTKTIINEFVAFKLLGQYKADGKISVSQKKIYCTTDINFLLIIFSAKIISNCYFCHMQFC